MKATGRSLLSYTTCFKLVCREEREGEEREMRGREEEGEE
jgi:hypothetical protein